MKRKVKVSYDPVGDLLEIELRPTKIVYDIIDGGNGVDILDRQERPHPGNPNMELIKILKETP